MISTVRRSGSSIIPEFLSLVSCRLTVSIVSPSTSPICWRSSGNSNLSTSGANALQLLSPWRAETSSSKVAIRSDAVFLAEQHHPLARAIKLVERALQQLMLKIVMLTGETIKCRAREDADLGIG